MNKIHKIYTSLLEKYGPQGWWPYLNFDGLNESKTGNIEGYHIGDYSYPKNDDQIFEVALGSILTQNTTFVSVVKAMKNLNTKGGITKDAVKALSIDELKEAITLHKAERKWKDSDMCIYTAKDSITHSSIINIKVF